MIDCNRFNLSNLLISRHVEEAVHDDTARSGHLNPDGRTNMMRAYWRCNGGHYFCTSRCPFDGWSSPELQALHDAAQRLVLNDISPSLAALRAEGVSDGALRRAMVVEFGSEEAVFDAISPDYYVIAGKEVKLRKAGPAFL